ncbi:MAG: hypothetical protein PHD97_03765 [Bacteroidales bacterium]|nr:hypothetical protein [Bacteroidales bacterium]
MKRVISIILICGFAYSINGYYLNFKVEQFQIKENIKKEIQKHLNTYNKKLVVLKFSFNNLLKIKWIKKNKEFLYDGNMYDVVKSEVSADTIYYYCINDRKEKELITDFDKNTKEQTGKSKKANNFKKRINNYFFGEIINAGITKEISISYFNYTIDYKSVYKNNLSPPPKS